jgi:head-tail adaptor
MPRPLQSGHFRQRVILQDIPETTGDSYGQRSLAPVEIGRFWAFVQPLQGEEKLNVRQIWPTATHEVWMRWLGSQIPTSATNPHGLILPRMRLVSILDGAELNIVFAENVEKRNRQWKLVCEEKVKT